MKVRIEEIRIQNFRALENVRLRVGDLTFLVGRNGAGKSSVLDAVEFMREALTDSLRNALDRRGGFENIFRRGAPTGSPMGLAVVLTVETEPERSVPVLYGFQVQRQEQHPSYHIREALRFPSPLQELGFTRDGVAFQSSQNIAPGIVEEGLALSLVAHASRLWSVAWMTLRSMMSYELSPSTIRMASPIGTTSNLLRDGSNAGDVLNFLQDRVRPDYDWLITHLSGVTDGIKVVAAEAAFGRRMIRFLQEPEVSVEKSFDASQISTGTLRALAILLALCQQPRPSLVLIDEIEDSMHPLALQVLLEAAESRADRFPVVLTTHSPEVLGTKQVTPDRVRILQWSQGVSRLYPLSAGTKKSVDSVTTVGDLLRYNALWPDDSPETFTGDILEL